MITIHLNNLSFYSYHGLFDHERINGNSFVVNATINYLPNTLVVAIEQTIDYVSIYELIKQRMAVATPLLETIVMEIAKAIIDQYVVAKEVEIAITKENPPIPDFEGSVGVSFKLIRN
jgi:dihydroneopterin aldolase